LPAADPLAQSATSAMVSAAAAKIRLIISPLY
jgi:hypothetical protein